MDKNGQMGQMCPDKSNSSNGSVVREAKWVKGWMERLDESEGVKMVKLVMLIWSEWYLLMGPEGSE